MSARAVKGTGLARLSLVLLAAQVFAAGGGAMATLLLARAMPAEAFGHGMALISAAMLGALFVGGNLEAGALRFLGRGSAEAAYVRFSRRLILAGGIVGAALCLMAWVLGAAASGRELALLALLMPLLAMMRATARQGAALGAAGRTVLPRLLTRPAVFLCAGLLAAAAGSAPPGWALPALLLAATAGAIAVQLVLLRDQFRRLTGPARHDRARVRAWLATGVGMMPGLLFLELHRDFVIAAGSAVLPAEALAGLAVALTLAAVPALAVIAVEVATGPRIAGAQASGRADALRGRLAEAAWLRLAAGSPALLGLGLCVGPVFAFLGPAHAGHGGLVWMLAGIPVTRIVLGNPLQLLMLAGETALSFRICAVGAAGSACCIAGAGATWGAEGAAAGATAGFMVVWAVLWRGCCRRGRADPSLRALWPGKAAGPDRRSPDPARPVPGDAPAAARKAVAPVRWRGSGAKAPGAARTAPRTCRGKAWAHRENR